MSIILLIIINDLFSDIVLPDQSTPDGDCIDESDPLDDEINEGRSMCFDLIS